MSFARQDFNVLGRQKILPHTGNKVGFISSRGEEQHDDGGDHHRGGGDDDDDDRRSSRKLARSNGSSSATTKFMKKSSSNHLAANNILHIPSNVPTSSIHPPSSNHQAAAVQHMHSSSRSHSRQQQYPPGGDEFSDLSSSSHYYSLTQSNNKENITTSPSPKHSKKINEKPRHHKKHKRTASLTDLRPEDKKKVANLIQELANLGSEKERIETCLKSERNNFEDAIKDLVSDQKVLLSERQSVQAELHSCQQMLSQLQEAVLHRPTSSALSSQHSDNKDNDFGVMLDNKPGDASHCSELENYISRHNNTQEMDATSELRSVTSESVRNPRTSSTFIIDGNLHSTASLSNGSVHHANSTIEYSRKDEIFAERARLIEEQRLLRQRLIQQEELLRSTQQRLYLREHELTEHRYREATPRQTVRTDTRESNPASIREQVHIIQPYGGNPAADSTFTMGVQVGGAVQQTPVVERTPIVHTHDHSVQTELPMQFRKTEDHSSAEERMYIGNRLVPSPSNCTSRSQSSMQQTIEKTNRLLESAKKVIQDAESPRGSLVSRSSSRCSHTYQTHTPRKTNKQLFDSADRSLATELNSTTAEEADNTAVEGDADRTEMEMLEDIFYVR